MKHARSSRAAAAFVVTWVVGCGGSTGGSTGQTGGPDGSAAAGGASSGSGGASGHGGAVSGTGGAAPGAGGTPNCFAACPPIHCAVGFRSVTPAGACCASCVKDCGLVDCAMPKCLPGSVSYTPPDQCCPICGPDCSTVDCASPVCEPPSRLVTAPGACCGSCSVVDGGTPSCNPQIGPFVQNQIAVLGALSCQSSTECVIVSLGGRCQLDCGTAVNTKSASALASAVDSYSTANCTGCPVTNQACPPVVFTAECRAGICTRLP